MKMFPLILLLQMVRNWPFRAIGRRIRGLIHSHAAGSIAIMGGTAAVYHLDRSPRYGVRFNPKAITQRSLEASELLRKTGDDAYEHFVFPVAKARIKNQENDEIGVVRSPHGARAAARLLILAATGPVPGGFDKF